MDSASCQAKTRGSHKKNTRIPSSQHKLKREENLEQHSHGEAGGEEDEGREQEAVGFAPAHHPHIQREHPPSTTPPFPSPQSRGTDLLNHLVHRRSSPSNLLIGQLVLWYNFL